MASTPAKRFSTALGVTAATVCGNLWLVVGTLLFAIASILAALVPPRGRHVYRVARLWARSILAAGFVRVRVSHEAPLDRDGRYVFLANHQSLFDIPALFVAIPGQMRFLAKASLFRLPVFGWALRLGGFVPVDRGDREQARRSFAAALDRLERGMSILIFPEETRSLDGRLLPFRRGGLLLALKSGLPAVPVGIEGTLAVQTRRSFLIRPRTVDIRFGAPIDLDGQSVRRLGDLSDTLRSKIATLAGTTPAP